MRNYVISMYYDGRYLKVNSRGTSSSDALIHLENNPSFNKAKEYKIFSVCLA